MAIWERAEEEERLGVVFDRGLVERHQLPGAVHITVVVEVRPGAVTRRLIGDRFGVHGVGTIHQRLYFGVGRVHISRSAPDRHDVALVENVAAVEVDAPPQFAHPERPPDQHVQRAGAWQAIVVGQADQTVSGQIGARIRQPRPPAEDQRALEVGEHVGTEESRSPTGRSLPRADQDKAVPAIIVQGEFNLGRERGVPGDGIHSDLLAQQERTGRRRVGLLQGVAHPESPVPPELPLQNQLEALYRSCVGVAKNA
jgi:hypothetical protein